jgi:hypothetical protein
MHPATQEWKRTCESGTPRVISTFYEAIAREMTDGQTPEDREEGDLYFNAINGADIAAEVKGGGSQNPLRIKWKQLEEHKKRSLVFPYEGHFIYFLFSYSPRSSKGPRGSNIRKNLIRDAVESGNGEGLLAERTRNLWIVPLPLIEWLRGDNQLTLSFMTRRGEDGRTFDVNRGMLRDLADQNRNLLPTPWNVREGMLDLLVSLPSKSPEDEPVVYPVSFPVTYFRDHQMPEIDFRHVQWQP